MHAYLVNPELRAIITVKNFSGGYDALQALLATDPEYSGTFTVVEINEAGDTVFIDDEGMLKAGRPCFRLGNTYLAGIGVVLGTDDDGESVAPTITLAGLAKLITWTDLESTGDFGPSSQHTNEDGSGFVFIGGQPILRKRGEKS
jgi:hypothetical protein